MSVTAMISHISRGSLHDGPGVRTVVYLMGCPLRCRWCHNPEALLAHPRTVFKSNLCIGCGRCVDTCPEHHAVVNGKMVFRSEGCSACGRCVEACPAGALDVIGEKKSVDEVFEEIKKDLHYYTASGGGVTFSGGECLLYPEFVAALAKKCSNKGIHTAVESSFCVPWAHVEAVLQWIDLFYVDCKLADPQKHELYTGRDNRMILENLRKLAQTGKPTVLRIPIIPQVNDTREDMIRFGEILSAYGQGIRSVELLKYNYLARSKYELIGEAYTSFAQASQTDEEMAGYAQLLSEKTGLPVVF